jgi:glycosyltransferase involved in cell wall biosynthesis
MSGKPSSGEGGTARAEGGEACERPALSVVAPARDEARNLPALVDEIETACAGLGSFEILIVDDASSDDTPGVLDRIAKAHPALRWCRLPEPSGQSAALLAGLHRARGDVIATLDADLQNDPRDIPALLRLLADADVVQGWRVARRDPWSRRVAGRVANAIRRAVLRDHVADIGCSLRVFRAACVRGLPPFRTLHRFLPAILEMEGFRLVQAPVSHRPRRGGRSKYDNRRRVFEGTADLLAMLWLRRRVLRKEIFRDA